jgi:hypothetical protein
MFRQTVEKRSFRSIRRPLKPMAGLTDKGISGAQRGEINVLASMRLAQGGYSSSSLAQSYDLTTPFVSYEVYISKTCPCRLHKCRPVTYPSG